MRNQSEAYANAALLDQKIVFLMKEFPIGENWRYWMLFSRTVGTSLNILDYEIEIARKNEREQRITPK